MIVLRHYPHYELDKDKGYVLREMIKQDEELPMPEPNVGNLKPHPWDKRKRAVLDEYKKRIKPLVEPFGYQRPYDPNLQDIASDEMAWLVATQNEELAPEWLRLAANGLSATSLNSPPEESSSEDDDSPEPLDSQAQAEWAAQLAEWGESIEDHRIEPFLKVEDERNWYSTLPKRYWWAYNAAGQVGLIPGNQRTTVQDCRAMLKELTDRGLKPTLDEVKSMARARIDGPKRPPREYGDLDRWLDHLDPERLSLLEEDDQTRYDNQNGTVTYAPSVPCPGIETGECVDGQALVEITVRKGIDKTVFTEHYDRCPQCNGTTVVPHTLGLYGM